jgi:energy-coupling factor transporter ATP-binding protein EcfA2
MTEKPILEIQNLTFRFDDKTILKNISLELWPGDLVLLCGESGAGKSTLAKVLCGHFPENGGQVETGNIRVSGQDVTDFPASKRSTYITSLFQNAAGSFSMPNLRQEMIFCLENLETPPDAIDDVIDRVVKKLDLASLLDRDFTDLSGGEVERCALAIAELYPGDLYVLDEPFANLDDEAVRECQERIEKWRKEGKAVLVIDHRLEHWTDCTKRYLLDSNGRIVEVNDENLYENGLKIDWSKQDLRDDCRTSERAVETQAEEANPILELEDFSLLVGAQRPGLFRRQWRGGEEIVRADRLTIPAGQLVALTGPSGSGKSSFFRALLGECAYKGKIRFDGQALDKMKKRQVFDRVGIVFQDPALQFVKLDVATEIAFSVKLWEEPDQSLEDLAKADRVKELLSRYSLDDKADSSPWLLSQGEQRRLAVLTMLPGVRRLLLVDEPTYGQDMRHGVEIMETLRALTDEGISCIFTSHDPALVNRYADCRIVIDHGEMRRLK